MKNLIQKEYWGLYNCVCGGRTNRMDVCAEILKLLGLQDKIRINSVTSDFYAKEYFAPRPSSECLWSRKLDLRGLNVLRNWRLALKEYIEDYYKGYIN